MTDPRRRAVLTTLLGLVTAAFVVPALWLVSVSLKTKAGVYAYPPSLLPDDASLANYAFVLTRTEVPAYLWNSGKVAVLATLLTVAVSIPVAWALSREHVPRRRLILHALVAAQMVSPVVLLVPIYQLVSGLRLLDTHAGLVLVYAAVQVPFTIVLLKTFFDAVPTAVLEAARLDGASRAAIVRRIALPLVAPGLAAAAIFDLVSYWSEFALSLVLIDSQRRFTTPVGLFSFQSGYETEWHLVAAASMLALVPALLAFAVLQRFFSAGLTAGAVKG